ncbi:hypothetical protein GCM10023319_24160 [Nocardia iowensis]
MQFAQRFTGPVPGETEFGVFQAHLRAMCLFAHLDGDPTGRGIPDRVECQCDRHRAGFACLAGDAHPEVVAVAREKLAAVDPSSDHVGKRGRCPIGAPQQALELAVPAGRRKIGAEADQRGTGLREELVLRGRAEEVAAVGIDLDHDAVVDLHQPEPGHLDLPVVCAVQSPMGVVRRVPEVRRAGRHESVTPSGAVVERPARTENLPVRVHLKLVVLARPAVPPVIHPGIVRHRRRVAVSIPLDGIRLPPSRFGVPQGFPGTALAFGIHRGELVATLPEVGDDGLGEFAELDGPVVTAGQFQWARAASEILVPEWVDGEFGGFLAESDRDDGALEFDPEPV